MEKLSDGMIMISVCIWWFPVPWTSHKDQETIVAGLHKCSGKSAAVH